MDASLLPFFAPRGVAVIGVSQDLTKLGYGLARNLVNSRYAGAIHFVSPRGGTLLERPVYPAIKDVPDPVDLGVIVISAQQVPAALQECGARGIKCVIIASGGFREVGAAGAQLEQTCLEIAQALGIRLIGPNCIGLLDTHLPIDTTFLPPPGPLPGEVAFLSHSGAICEAVIDWASGQGFGLSRLVSLGNQTDLGEGDLLAPVAEDPHTRVLTLYLEGIKNGRRFVEQAYEVTRHKPVIALKVGRFASGQKAVASHTGALAGQEAAYNAAFRKAGVIRAETSEEMFDWARALAWSPLPKGKAMAVLTNAGGPGAIAADALEFNGLTLANLQDFTREKLRALLPPAASLRNPVDMLASASPEQYASGLQLLLADPGVHGVLVILPPPPMYTAEAVVAAMIPIIKNAKKPVVFALMGELLIHTASELLRAERIPDYRFPERAASALAMLAQRVDTLKRAQIASVTFGDVRPNVVQTLLEKCAPGFIDSAVAMEMLCAYGLPVRALDLARSPEEAAQLADDMGYPVVLKVASPEITHKSDVGGVLLNVTDAERVKDGYHTVTQNALQSQPHATILGVHVQQMWPAGQEVIIGAVQDPQFGPLVMFGSGGVEVEGLKDVAFALAPLAWDDTRYLLDHTWAGRKLKGYRNIPPADQHLVMEALLRLGQLVSDFPQIAEVEINPLRVFLDGQGGVVLDARIKRA